MEIVFLIFDLYILYANMKKFTFKGVLDGFRQTVQPQAIRQEQEIQETLKTEQFALRKVI